MLVDDNGTRWGTAAELAQHLGGGVTIAAIRNWARRDGLTSARMTDDDGRPEVRYALDQAAAIDRAKRHAKRGRTRTNLTRTGFIDHTATKHDSARITATAA